MNKFFFILFINLFISLLAFPQSKNSVTLNLVTKNLELKPGRINTIVFKINNNSSEKVELKPEIILPHNWKLITELKKQSIKSSEQQIQIVSFNIPSKYKSGTYPIKYNLLNGSNQEIKLAISDFEVKVVEEAGLTIELVASPEFVKAGETINASFIVRNTGNTLQTISLSSFNCSVTGNQKITLPVGSSSVVNVDSKTDENLAFASRQSFYLQAKGATGSAQQLYSFVRIVPSIETENDLFHRFPVSVTSRYLAKGRDKSYQAGYQIEVEGHGTIDPEGIHKVDFIARGPNQFDLSLLGLYDQYYFSYSNNLFKLKVGDNSYGFTPLTEYSRYGSGFEGTIKVTDYSNIGFLYMKPRFYDKIKSEYGAYGTINFYKKNLIGLYFLKKILPEQKNDINLYSVTAELFPFEKTTVEVEASRGSNGILNDNALRFNFNSQFSKISMSSFYFHTGKNYPGYYSNSKFYSGFINYQVKKWVSVGISGRQDFSNAELDTLFSTAPFSKQYQGMINFKIGKRMFFKTYYRQYERKDRSPLNKFHFESQTVNALYSHRLNKFAYRLEGEFGKTVNYLLTPENNEKNTFRGTGNFNYRPNQKHSFQGFVTYTNVNSFISNQENNWIFGITASSNIIKNLRANLHLQNSYSIEEYYRNRNLLQFNLDYRFLKRHKLSVNSFYTIFQDEVSKPDFSIAISYSVKFGIPLKQIAEAGTISGKIANLGIDTIEGIILQTGGQSAVTDEYGNFYFKNLMPGEYNVFVDRSTVKMNDIPDISTPIMVNVEGNKETQINFGITKASKLTGTIFIEKVKSTSKLFDDDEEVRIGHIVLEIHRGNESIRIISDGNGNFNFPLIRPGKWFLKVYSNGIDKGYSLEKDHFEFNFMPGEEKEIKIKVLKKKRNIIFINNSINLSSGNKK